MQIRKKSVKFLSAMLLLSVLGISCVRTVVKQQYIGDGECVEILQAKHDSLVVAKEIIEDLLDNMVIQ
jgi:hypothetical protein